MAVFTYFRHSGNTVVSRIAYLMINPCIHASTLQLDITIRPNTNVLGENASEIIWGETPTSTISQ